MARIEKRGARWRVRIRLGGNDISESFRTKAEAAAWAAQQEADINAGKHGKVPDKSFGDMLRRYPAESKWDKTRINALLTDDLAQVRLPDIGPEHIAAWRDRRLAKVSPATVRREWNLLSGICTLAINEWRWLRDHPMRSVKRPESAPPRTRRITQDEIDRIVWACGDTAETQQGRVGLAFRFALETAMRAGEILALEWADIDVGKRVAYVRAVKPGAKKTGISRVVPLSSAALAIIERLSRSNPTLFAMNSASLDALFRKAKRRAIIDGLHFHDSRAEALTRLSKKLDVMQLARVSGHRDLQTLHNVYYREQAEDMARLLD